MVDSLVSFGLVGGSVSAAALLTVLAYRQRPQPGAVSFAALMAGATWWVATSSVGLFSTDPQWRLALASLEWLGFAIVPLAWLMFTLEYTSRDEWVSLRTTAVLVVVPATTLFLVATNDAHGLVYAAQRVQVYGDISLVQRAYGPWFWVHTVYAYLLLAVGTGFLLELMVGARSVYQGQALALLITIAAPWVGNLVYVTGNSPVPGFDPTPFTFVISGAVGIAALTQFRLLDAVPVSSRVARETVVESMSDGVVAVDSEHTVVDVNPRAAAILGCSPADAVGDDARTLVPEYDRLVDVEDGTTKETVEIEHHSGTRYYEVTVSGMRDTHGRETGRVVVVHDVTERRNRVQQLDVLNRVLRHNLRNEMNVIYGYADQVDDDEASVRIKERAMEMVDLSEKAREIDHVLDDTGPGHTVGVADLLGIEHRRTAERYRGVDFEFSEPSEPAAVPQGFGSVLRNLVENAAEHNCGDRQRVWVDARTDADEVVVEVRDDGPGIPEGERTVLDAGEETPLEHSSGLGLWLVTWGVERMGGSVTVTVTGPDGDDEGPTTVDRTGDADTERSNGLAGSGPSDPPGPHSNGDGSGPQSGTLVRVRVPKASARQSLPTD